MAKSYTVSAKLEAKDNASGKIRGVRGAFTDLGSFLTSGWTAAIAGATAAFAGLLALFKRGVSEAIETEGSISRLEIALRSLGPAASSASAALQAQAEAIQKSTRFSDDAVLAAQALLANMRVSASEIPTVTQAAVDLAAAWGVDLQTAAAALGKTLNGVVTRDLGQMIPTLRDLDTASLKAGAAIKVVVAQTKGAAAKDAQTFSAQIDRLTNSFDELLGKLGESVTKNPAVTEAFSQLRKVLTDPKTVSAAEDLATAIIGISTAVVKAAQGLPDGVQKILDFGRGIAEIGTTLNGFGVDFGKLFLEVLKQTFPTTTLAAQGVGLLGDAVVTLGEKAREAGAAAKEQAAATETAGEAAQDAAGKIDVLTASQQRLNNEMKAGKDALDAAGIVIRDFDEEAKRLDQALAVVERRFALGVTSQAEYRFELEQVRRKQAELAEAITGAVTPIADFASRSRDAAEAIRDMNSAQGQTADKFDATARAAVRAADAVDRFNRSASAGGQPSQISQGTRLLSDVSRNLSELRPAGTRRVDVAG